MDHQLRMASADGSAMDADAHETLREAALFMYHQYLSQEVQKRIFKNQVNVFFKAITRVPLSEAIINKFLARLRNDEPSDVWFEQIQEKVMNV